MVEQVELTSDYNRSLICRQEHQSSLLYSAQGHFAEESLKLICLKSAEKAEFLKQVENVRHLVELPAFASFVKVPELDVVLRLVAFEQAFLLESVEKVDFPVQTARVSHLMLLLHLSVDLLDHIKVVPNALIVLHDHLITL